MTYAICIYYISIKLTYYICTHTIYLIHKEGKSPLCIKYIVNKPTLRSQLKLGR